MIQDEIFTLLDSASAYKVFPLAIPQKEAFPAIRYARVTNSRDMNYDEVENFVSSTFQVDSYAQEYAASLSLAESVKSTMNDYTGGTIQKIRLDFEVDTLEDEADLYRVLQQYTVWHTE